MAKSRAQAETVGTANRTYAERCAGDGEGTETETKTEGWPTIWASETVFTAPAEHWTRTVGTLTGLYQLRVRKDFEMLAGLSLCRTPQEVGALWVRTACEAATDYAEALGKVVAQDK